MMIQKLYISLALICSLACVNTYADVVGTCEKEAANFGNGQGPDLISTGCYNVYIKLAGINANKKTEDGALHVFGFKSLLFINKKIGDEPVKHLVIAGTSTELHDLVAVALDPANNEIAVLEKSGDILFFSSIITGNVAPYRILRSKELDGASDLVVDPKADHVVVLNRKSGSVLHFSRKANYLGAEGKKNLALIKSDDLTSQTAILFKPKPIPLLAK